MIPFTQKPWLHLALYTAFGFACVQWLGVLAWGGNVLCFTLVGALLWGVLNRPPRITWPWLAAGFAIAAGFALWEQPLAFLLVPAWALCLALWAMEKSDARPQGILASLLPFEQLPAAGTALGQGLAKGQRISRILIGCLMALPLLVLIGLLLSSAEDAFGHLFARLFESLEGNLGGYLAKGVLAILIGLYLCCFSQSCRSDKRIAPAKVPQGDGLVISAMMTLLCLMYLLFLVVSAQVLPTLFNASHGAEVYSRYARQGFFELCAAASLNLMVCLITRRFAAARQGAPRILNGLLAACTLCLIGLALVKMALYIHLYGLTLLRFYTSCFMGLMAIFFILLMVSLFRPLSLWRWGLRLAAGMLVLLSLLNTGGLIARSNTQRYLAGELGQLDLAPYRSFPRSAAPALAEVYQTIEDPALKAELEEFFTAQRSDAPSLWRASYQAVQGQRLINQLVP